MKRRTMTVVAILMILLLSVFGTVGAQVTADDPEVPTDEETTDGSQFYTHPVVQLLSAYFDRELVDEEDPADPEDPDDMDGDEDPLEPPDEDTDGEGEDDDSDSGLGPIGEEIAAYHEDGMGFGVLVKIYAMVEESQLACESQVPEEGEDAGEGDPVEECVPLTADELVTAFKSGTGIGLLFKEYGKPALLGVGHVKQELKKLDMDDPVDDGTDIDDGMGDDMDGVTVKDNNGKPMKDKPAKPLKPEKIEKKDKKDK